MRGRRILPLAATILVVLSACAWTQRGGDAGRSGYNSFGGIDTTNASALHEVWRSAVPLSGPGILDGTYTYGVHDTAGFTARVEAYATDGNERCAGSPRVCEPVWVTTPMDTGSITHLLNIGLPVLTERYLAVTYAQSGQFVISIFDRAGVDGCTTAVPRVCSPLGTTQLFPVRAGDASPSLTTGDGVLFAVGWLSEGSASVAAIHIPQIVGCAAGPECAPFWRATTDTLNGSPAYTDGRLYVRSSSGARVFDASGVQNCGFGLCSPLWTYTFPVPAQVLITVAHGRVIQNGQGRVSVYDAQGIDGCGGSPRVCDPLWQSDTAPTFQTPTDAVLVTDRIVVASGVTASGTGVQAYDLAGTDNCSGAPRVCSPLWQVPLTRGSIDIIGSGPVGITGGAGGGSTAPIVIFRLDGQGCNPTTGVCTAVATLPPIVGSPTAVAAGRVVVTSVGNPIRVYAAA